MNRHHLARFVLTAMTASVAFSQSNSLEVYSVDPFALLRVRSSLQSTSSPFKPAYKKLLRDAEKAMDLDPVSVTEKDATPPSGDKRDYMSLSRYWWPDPSKPDGLPYVRRDGETNPEINKFPDQQLFGTMVSAVVPLSLAYFFSGDELYARHASKLIRTWFLDESKGMNPNLQYSQAVPGRSEGRGAGVLDGRHTALVIDAVGMIRGSKSWTAHDDSSLRAWFGRYVTWLTESENGRDESDAMNNHGTWYDAQVVPAALYAGRTDIAGRIIGAAAEKRILAQIEPDGSQPKELARTRPFHYSVFNLEAHARLATQAKRLGVDLWDPSTEAGRRIRAAVDHLLPFARGEKEWPYKDLDGIQRSPLATVLLRVYGLTNDPNHRSAAIALGDAKFGTLRDLLLTGVSPLP
jgi:hypothetical protein